MSIWYRVCKSKYKHTAFSGDGALQVSGRWHKKGVKAVYCSTTISLAALEWLSHAGLAAINIEWTKLKIDIPDAEIIIPKIADLPPGWNSIPDSDISRNFADVVLFQANKLALVVPSIVIPEEFNLILNPLHPMAQNLTFTDLGNNQFHSRIIAR